MLDIHSLTKSFHYPVLENLSLKVERGDLIYIHGINGSGKSTLFKIISGILDADCGEVHMSKDCHLGALIENPGFLDHESLAFNLRFLASLKNNFQQDKIEALCQDFHLDYKNKAPMKTYSLGMRQKAGIIQAVMEEQNLILFDEPTRGLDQDAIECFISLIIKLHQEKKTIIIAAHDYLEALPFNHTYRLENGHLQAD